MLPRRDATDLRAGKAVGEGAPSQKTCRAPPCRTPRGRRIRSASFARSRRVVLAAVCVLVLVRRRVWRPVRRGANAVPRHDHDARRQGHGHEEAAPDRLALTHRDRVALRDRRRPPGRRSRQPVRLPEERAKTSLSGFTPNVEAIAGYRPDLVVISFDPKGLARALRRLKITVVHHDAAPPLKGAYHADPPARPRHRQRDEGDTLLAQDEAGEDRTASSPAPKARCPRALRLPRARPRCSSRRRRTRSSARSYARSGLENIADEADTSATGGYPQLSAEYVVSSIPDLIVLADAVCCGQSPATVAAGRAGIAINAVRTGSIVRMDDSIASRWGPRLRELLPRDVLRARAASPVGIR